MYQELYQYFILHRQLHLPGIGTFQLDHRPAEIDFVGKLVTVPRNVITLHHTAHLNNTRVFEWLASSMETDESQAATRFDEFVSELRARILSGNRIGWNGIGTLSRGLAGEIRFEPAQPVTFTESIPATKVIREYAEHNVRVGEQEKTSAEMLEMLQPVEEKKNYSWVAILILVIAAILFSAWYLFAHGLTPTAAGNTRSVEPSEIPASRGVTP